MLNGSVWEDKWLWIIVIWSVLPHHDPSKTAHHPATYHSPACWHRSLEGPKWWDKWSTVSKSPIFSPGTYQEDLQLLQVLFFCSWQFAKKKSDQTSWKNPVICWVPKKIIQKSWRNSENQVDFISASIFLSWFPWPADPHSAPGMVPLVVVEVVNLMATISTVNILELEPLIFHGICNILVLNLFMLDGILRLGSI